MRAEWRDKEFLEKALIHFTQNLERAALIVERQAKRNVRPGGASGFKTSHGGSGLHGSITHVTRFPWAKIGTSIKYGLLQELGGWVYPKSRRALSVPIHKSAERGMAKYTADLTLIPSKMRGGRPGLLVRKHETGKGGAAARKPRWDLMYLLMTRVYVPARAYLLPAFMTTKAQILKALGREMRTRRKKE